MYSVDCNLAEACAGALDALSAWEVVSRLTGEERTAYFRRMAEAFGLRPDYF